MPPSSSHDDPFADLFAKLPDPRARAASGQASDAPGERASDAASGGVRDAASETAGARTPSAPTPSVPPRDPEPAGNDTAPLSRREAREAAVRSSAENPSTPQEPAPRSAAQDPGSPASSQDTVVPQPASQEHAEPVAAPLSAALASTAPRTPSPAPRPAPAPSSGPPAKPPTLDDLFTESSERDSRDTPKKKRHVGGWIALGIVLVLIGGVVGGGVWVWNTYESKIREVMGWEEPKDYEAGLAHGEALVTIAEGDVPATISKSLFKAGVTKTSDAFYDMLIKTQQNPTFYPGVYKLQQQMSASAALDALKDPDSKLENSALVREGLTVDAILPILAESLSLPLADFQAAVAKPSDYGVSADSLEGWLFPAMYTFDPGATAKDVIAKMVDRTKQSLDDAGVPEAERQRILTVASIIQREARFEADFYKVSRVIENRLDPKNQETFGYLQMDSTAQYGYGELHEGKVSTSEQAQKDDNPWNTYAHTGLPKGPISSPGDTAIDAAMHPADGNWLYFVTVNLDTGETVFTKTYSEHQKYVKQFQNWCSKNPDSGC